MPKGLKPEDYLPVPVQQRYEHAVTVCRRALHAIRTAQRAGKLPVHDEPWLAVDSGLFEVVRLYAQELPRNSEDAAAECLTCANTSECATFPHLLGHAKAYATGPCPDYTEAT